MPLFLAPLKPLLRVILSCADRLFRHFTAPVSGSLLAGTLTGLPRSQAELLAENAVLRHQVLILQRQVKRPLLHRRTRLWLLVLASRVASWKQALLIIQPDTLLHWHRQGFRLFWKRRSRSQTNQPKIGRETTDLIQQMAHENLLWGAERIQGELLKLGVRVAKLTIQKYVRLVQPPRAFGQTWTMFLKAQAKDVWACDFLPVVDLFFRQAFVFFIIELSSRRVVHFGVTRAPCAAWVAQPLREAKPFGAGPKYLIRDNDS